MSIRRQHTNSIDRDPVYRYQKVLPAYLSGFEQPSISSQFVTGEEI
jgi:hypothetical protein